MEFAADNFFGFDFDLSAKKNWVSKQFGPKEFSFEQAQNLCIGA